MRALLTVTLTAALLCSHAVLVRSGQVPGPANAPDVPVSARDRLYLSDQSSNAVSVLDPSDNKLLGIIKLGERPSDTLSAVYRGQSLVHGMGFSPDSSTLAVVCVASNAVVFVNTRDSSVKHTAYVGRAPHEAMWTPNGEEVWVAVRGEDYIQVLDGNTYQPKRRVQVPKGPGMTIFSPDGKYAYICSSFTPETVVVDTATYNIAGRIKQASTFCPNIAATPDGSQVWFTLKDTGKTQIFDARPPFKTLAILETGPITNHVNFATTPKGQVAYVTVGGLRQVKVFSTEVTPQLLATITAGENPHGLWPSGDGSRMYVGLQLGNAVAVVDTASNRVLQTVPVGGQAPMALMYVPRAVPAGIKAEEASANLIAPAEAQAAAQALHVDLVPTPGGSKGGATAGQGATAQQVLSSVTINNQGFTDALEAAVTGLKPGQQYVLALADNREGSGDVEPLVSFTGGKDGAASVATFGPFTSMVMRGGASSSASSKRRQSRFLVIAELNGSGRNSKVGSVVQVQQAEAL